MSGGIERVGNAFAQSAQPSGSTVKTRPFSIRLTEEERTILERQAGARPLGAYVREVLLGEKAANRNHGRAPRPDDRKVALMLARLGQSKISVSLADLAEAARTGAIDLDEGTTRQLQHACAAVVAMRHALLIALKIQPKS